MNGAACVSPMLPEAVRAPWQPVLALLEEKYGPPAERPKPIVKITDWVESFDGLSLEAFTARARADGVAAAVAELAAAPVPGTPKTMTRAVVMVRAPGCSASSSPRTRVPGRRPGRGGGVRRAPALQTAYFNFNALHHSAGIDRLSHSLLGPLSQAAFAVRPQGAGVPEATQLQLVISNLLHRLWDSGASLGSGPPGRCPRLTLPRSRRAKWRQHVAWPTVPHLRR